MFINTGLLIETKDPGAVIGVIAHETGHIAGGHLARSGPALEQTYATLIATYLLGLGAALATGEPGLGAAVLSGGQDIRSEEPPSELQSLLRNPYAALCLK